MTRFRDWLGRRLQRTDDAWARWCREAEQMRQLRRAR